MRTITWQTLGLWSFCFTVIVALLILFYDRWLCVTGREMITTYTREHPWLAWVILVFLQFGVIGLAVHFMAPVPIEE